MFLTFVSLSSCLQLTSSHLILTHVQGAMDSLRVSGSLPWKANKFCTDIVFPDSFFFLNFAHGTVLYFANQITCCAGKCLQRLDLSDNPMTGDVAKALAAMLQHQPHLRALNLNDTSLEDAGVSTIAQALANSGVCRSWRACITGRACKPPDSLHLTGKEGS